VPGGGAVRAAGVVTLALDKTHGLKIGDYFTYFGCTDASFNGTFPVKTTPTASSLTYTQAGAGATSGGGSIGREESRYTVRTKILDHEAHQKAIGARGFNLTVQPRQVPIELDYGNNTSERVERLLAYQKVRLLGPDVTPYKAPAEFTLRAYREAVDATDNILLAQLCGDIVTLDRSVTEEFTGDYEILEEPGVELTSDGGGYIDLYLRTYQPTAFTDVAGAQPVTGATNPGPGVIYSGGPSNGSYRPTSNPLTATDAGATASINIATFLMRFSGLTPDPSYNSGAITNLSFAQLYFIYCQDPDRIGGAVAYKATTTKEDSIQASSWLYVGSIVTPNDGGADTVGNGDGGAGAQIGRILTLLPGAVAAPGWNNPGNASDYDAVSYADATATGAALALEAFSFPAFFGGFLSLVLKMLTQVTAYGAGSILVDYSIDDGLTWINDRTVVAVDANPVARQISLGVFQNTGKVRVRATLPATSTLGGPNNCGTAADLVGIGTVAWVNPTNAQGAGDNVYTTNTNSTLNTTKISHYLKCTNFGFALANTSIIDGIQVSIERKADSSPLDSDPWWVKDERISIVKAGVVQAVNRSLADFWQDAIEETKVFGGPTDGWDGGYLYSDINAATFGVAIAARLFRSAAAGANAVAYVDRVFITVYYHSAGNAMKVFSVTQEAQQ
jgi:hypothetical protein